jgi:class I fructose-bisphosphate aldolase
MVPGTMDHAGIVDALGADAERLLAHRCTALPRDLLVRPGPDVIDRVYAASDRSVPVLRSLGSLFAHGRLGGTGYLSILPVDQAVLYGAGGTFAPNPAYFDPDAIARLAHEAGSSALLSTFGVLGAVARRWAHRLPLVLKLNHHEHLTHPEHAVQTMFANVDSARDLGAVAVAATVYFGSADSARQIGEVTRAFARAHELGMATILFCYLRNDAFVRDGVDHHFSADLTGQANHIGCALGADIVKQKLPEQDGGARAVPGYARSLAVPEWLTGTHPIDRARFQVACSSMGRVPLINSGGPAGDADLTDAVRTAVINKRAGGVGLIAGRKAFQRPLAEGIALLEAIQAVYADPAIDLA